MEIDNSDNLGAGWMNSATSALRMPMLSLLRERQIESTPHTSVSRLPPNSLSQNIAWVGRALRGNRQLETTD